MKKPPARKTRARRSELRAEYRFDYSVSHPNRFAAHSESGDATAKVDPEIPEGD